MFGRPPPRTPLVKLTMLPQTPSRMVRGHPSHVSSLSASRSQDIQNGGVIRPRDNVFPGPAVALGGSMGAMCAITIYKALSAVLCIGISIFCSYNFIGFASFIGLKQPIEQKGNYQLEAEINIW